MFGAAALADTMGTGTAPRIAPLWGFDVDHNLSSHATGSPQFFIAFDTAWETDSFVLEADRGQ
jgi:hypothetical protein